MATPPRKENSDALWGIDQFAKVANDALSGKLADASGSKSADSRLTASMTPRNLRRLVAQGAIEPPERRGREAFFGPKHLEQVLATRELMMQGFTSSSIQAMRTAGAAKPFLGTELAQEGLFGLQDPYPQAHASLYSTQNLNNSDSTSSTTFASTAPHLSGSLGAMTSAVSSTASALDFLSQVSANTPVGFSAPSSGSTSDASKPAGWGQKAKSAFMGQSLILSTEDIELSSAYESLGKTRKPPPLAIGASLEAEPFAGLRLSVKPCGSMVPLTPAHKAQAIEAIEQLWAAALASQKKAPSEAGARDTAQTSPPTTTPLKDQP